MSEQTYQQQQQGGRHPLNTGHLVMGLAFLGIVVVWALVQTDTVVYRDLWKHIGKSMPKSTASANKLSPFDLNPLLLTALNSLYSHYAGEFERWQRAGIGVPPVFIVVCQNTAII